MTRSDIKHSLGEGEELFIQNQGIGLYKEEDEWLHKALGAWAWLEQRTWVSTERRHSSLLHKADSVTQ